MVAGYMKVGFPPWLPPYRFALARYMPDGSLDPSFRAAGKMATYIGTSAIANAVALDPSGRIVLAGSAFIGGKERVALARYAANGVLDTSFGQKGITVARFVGDRDVAYALALQPDGKIVISGHAYVTALGASWRLGSRIC